MIVIAVAAVLAASVLFYRELKTPTLVQNDSITAQSPKPNELIRSPVVVQGSARGSWFFEAVFPVKVLDGDGTIIGTGQARAQSDWMTADFVPFKAIVEFSQPKFSSGTVVFEKDNPSGLLQNAASIKIPVRFK